MNPSPFSQAVMWPNTTMGNGTVAEFEEFILETFDARAQFVDVYKTLPDRTPGSGGRSDLVFLIHEDDVAKFAVPRLEWGMRWVDDVLDNEAFWMKETGQEGASIYVQEVHALRSWK